MKTINVRPASKLSRLPRGRRLIPLISAGFLFAAWLHTPALASYRATRSVLPNGMILLHVEQRSLPLVTLRITFRAGAVDEPAEKAGLAALTANLMSEGTADRTAVGLQEAIEELGGRIGFSGGRDTSSGGMTVATTDLERGMQLFAEMLLHPSFPEKELQREVKETIGRIERSKQDPGSQARVAFRRALYGSHPYGRRLVGEVDSLRRIRRDDLVRFHRDHYRPKGAIAIVVGDIGRKAAEELLLKSLAGWVGSRPPTKSFARPKFPGSRKVEKIQRPVAQARVLFGHPGPLRNNPDYYAVRVMNYILGGGGFESRILKTIREEQGLAYSAWSYFSYGLQAGTFRAGLGTRNETANRALDALFEQIRRMRKEPVSEKELADAKAFITGSFPLGLAGNRNLASFYTNVELYNLGLDYIDRFPSLIRAVTRQDILRVAKKYLHPEDGILLILADGEKAKLKY